MSFSPDAWHAASVDQQDSKTEAPDPGSSGRASFDVQLDDARAFTSKAGNSVMVLDLRVMGGPMDTYTWTELRGFKTEGQMKAAKATCARMGIAVDQISGLDDLDAELKDRKGNYYEIEVVQNGDYRNVYFQGPSMSARPSDVPNNLPSREEIEAARQQVADDDKVPF